MKHTKTVIMLILILAAFIALAANSLAPLATKTSLPSGSPTKLDLIAERFDAEVVSFRELGGTDVEFEIRTSPPEPARASSVIAAAITEGVLEYSEEVGAKEFTEPLGDPYELRKYRGRSKP